MKTLLLTGFEKFAEHNINPTQELVLALDNKTINDFQITSYVLPVEYQKSSAELIQHINNLKPDCIISLGLAADRSDITPELIAINYTHSNTPDNTGVIKTFSKINNNSKESFFTSLPVEKMVLALSHNGFDAKLSTSAGSYVCNNVMYTALQTVALNKTDTRSGFIHIPTNLALDKLINALTICINTL
jgi:pyroglutamyl-peptidase